MQYPIILCHGIAPFDIWSGLLRLDNGKHLDRLHYFSGVRSHLERNGFKTFHSRVSWAGSTEKRARELADNVRGVLITTRADKVHLVCHSMAGLDARHMLFNSHQSEQGQLSHPWTDDYFLANHVASVTTISTPHYGTVVADQGVANDGWLLRLLGRFVDVDGIRDLQTASCRQFNDLSAEFEARSGILFQSYAGVSSRKRTFWPLRGSWDVISAKEGPNDGLVSVDSAAGRTGWFAGRIEGRDHLQELNWRGGDMLNFYRQIAHDLC